jgi:hypothetical protein
MKRNLILISAIVIITGALYWFSSYKGDIEISIVFDTISGIGPGSKLMFKGMAVGEVNSADITNDGKINVKAIIYKGYKDRVNSSSVFIIESTDIKGESDIKQITIDVPNGLAPPLSQGARIEGYSSRTQFFLRTQGKALEGSYRRFENWLNELQKGIKEFREDEKGKRLKEEMQQLMESVRKSTDKGIDEFKKEIPALKKRFDEIIEELKKLGRDKEAEEFRIEFDRHLDNLQNRNKET